MTKQACDIESGGAQARQLYPMQLESPELRWSFIRKVYSILSIQLLATIAVGVVVNTVKAIPHFFTSGVPGYVCLGILIFTPFIVLLLLFFFHQKHPVNYFLLGILTIALAFIVGLSCSTSRGKVILEAVILTGVVFVSLTLYTFWAVKRGHDFSFLGPFLFATLSILVVFSIIQIFHPFGKLGATIYACAGAIIFCGYIVYDTESLIKRHSYDEYIWASVELYLDILNLFQYTLILLGGSNNSS